MNYTVELTDIITATIGLLGTLIGAFITLSISKKEMKRQMLELMANQEEDIKNTQIEDKKAERNSLRKAQEFCFMLNVWLRRVLSFSNGTMIDVYEQTGVYPPISLAFVDEPSAFLSQELTIRLNDLYAYISFYNEMIKVPANKENLIREALITIYGDAQKAIDVCTISSQAYSENTIRQIEREILRLKIEKMKQFASRLLEKDMIRSK